MHSNYLTDVIRTSHRDSTVKEGVKQLTQVRFDTIVGCGVSGVSMGAIMALLLHKPLTIVRKNLDTDNHSIYKVEFDPCLSEPPIPKGCRYIVVDDSVDTGKTLLHITNSMTLALPESKCVGVWTYFNTQLIQGVTREVWYYDPQKQEYSATEVKVWL